MKGCATLQILYVAGIFGWFLYQEHSTTARLLMLLCTGVPFYVAYVIDRQILPEFRSIRERQDRILQRLAEIERRAGVSR